MTFDRFYSIVRPHMASSFNTVKKARITCVLIIIFGIIYNVPHIFLAAPRGYDCIPYAQNMNIIYGKIYYWLSFVVNYSFPFVSLLFMNCFIIHAIRTRKKLSVTNENDTKFKTSEKQIFIILLLVTFSFLLLTTPAYMLFLFNMIIDFNQSPKSQADFQLFFASSQRAWYTNNGINFFLYILSGTKFRNDFLRLFRCGKKSKEQSHTASTNDGGVERTEMSMTDM